MRKILLFFVVATMVVACSQSQKSTKAEETPALKSVLHKADIASLTPDSIVNILKKGNANFVAGKHLKRDEMAQLHESAEDGQAPMAIVLSCIDARVPVEMLFDMSVGDIFVSRIAGNVVSGDVLGSMEYACEHAGSKLVVVLGHESCGAVHSACEGAEGGNMTEMLAKIKPAIETVAAEGGDLHSEEFQNRVVVENVRNMIDGVRSGSEILSHLEREGEVKIVGAYFSLHTGEVKFLEE